MVTVAVSADRLCDNSAFCGYVDGDPLANPRGEGVEVADAVAAAVDDAGLALMLSSRELGRPGSAATTMA